LSWQLPPRLILLTKQVMRLKEVSPVIISILIERLVKRLVELLMKPLIGLLVKPLAIRLGYQKTIAKSLVMVKQLIGLLMKPLIGLLAI
jgi:hypothetical protein